MQDRKDAGQDECRTEMMQNRTDAGQKWCRTGQMQGRNDAEQDGCRAVQMYDRTDAGTNIQYSSHYRWWFLQSGSVTRFFCNFISLIQPIWASDKQVKMVSIKN